MNRFTKHILPQVPGCPTSLIEAEVLRAGIAFCASSWIWQTTSEVEVEADDDEIALTIPASNAALAGQKITLADTETEITEYTLSGATVTLDTAVTVDTDFDVTVYLKPSRDATALPDVLYNDYFEGVESKAKAELMSMPGKEWANPQLAMVNMQKYLHDLGKAAMKARKTNDQTKLRVKNHRFI